MAIKLNECTPKDDQNRNNLTEALKGLFESGQMPKLSVNLLSLSGGLRLEKVFESKNRHPNTQQTALTF
jgi:hypothetical protein